MKVALKIAYIGNNFYGSQRQKKLRTVDGEIINALIESNILDPENIDSYKSCCRTDSKVNAFEYVVSFDTFRSELPYTRIINSNLKKDDIFVYSYSIVNDRFHPRYDAISRSYRYIIQNDNYDIELMKKCAKLFIG